MCLTKIKAGLVISAFIYSDPVPVFFTSMFCFVLRLARTPLHKRVKITRKGHFGIWEFPPPHENTQPACQRCTSHKHKGKYGIAKGVGGRNKRDTAVMSRKKKTFSLKDDYDLFQT